MQKYRHKKYRQICPGPNGYAGTNYEVVETEETDNEGIEDRPDLREGCIIHMAIV